ncbi:MAG TPA: hypothetical protein VN696_03320 [Pyrinomonadaceae bacterium]|nr:hypothetical protein [Pyrinomonadaceae bacterium]
MPNGNSLPVARMKGFLFIAIACQPETRIGHDAVTVHEQKLDPPGPFSDISFEFQGSGFKFRVSSFESQVSSLEFQVMVGLADRQMTHETLETLNLKLET